MTADNKRKSISKGLRFDVFRRDGFTCRYCGRRPPEVVLEVDHILPVAEGGPTEINNLVTACYDCNHGKGKKLIFDTPPEFDADPAYLEAQQELAELRRYQEINEAVRRERANVIAILQRVYMTLLDSPISPDASIFEMMLDRYSPEEVEYAIRVTCPKKRQYFRGDDTEVLKYIWGVLKRRAQEQ